MLALVTIYAHHTTAADPLRHAATLSYMVACFRMLATARLTYSGPARASWSRVDSRTIYALAG